MLQTRDLVEALLDGREIDLRELARSAPVIPDLMDAMDALAVLRSADVPLALVHDEYGHFDGIVTPGSMLAALGRSVRARRRGGRASAWWSARTGAGSFQEPRARTCSDRLGVNMPQDRDYSTVAGFALSVLKRLPQTGETFSHDGWKFEVVDMDGRKIDKLLASRPEAAFARAGARDGRTGLELPEAALRIRRGRRGAR